MRRVVIFVIALVGISAAQTLNVAYQQKTNAVDIATLPHSDVKITDYHTKEERTFSCVPLATVLETVQVPKGDAVRGNAMSLIVIASAKDNYRVVFSLAELDESLGAKPVYICDKEGGKPLSERQAPLQLLVPTDKRPARSVRMLTRISVEDAAR